MLETSDFKCEDLGVMEDDVYDIEVEDNHNFFANGICVHNSVYISLNSLVNKMFPDKDNRNNTKIINFIDRFINENLEKEIQKTFDEFQLKLNHRQNLIVFKREAIADKAIFKGKKRYILNVWDNEGIRYSKPDLKVSGIEIVRSSTPQFCKDKLREAVSIIINGNNKELKSFTKKCRKEFREAPLNSIAFPRGVNGIDKYTGTNGDYISKTPMHVKAAIAYNKLLKDNKMNYVENIRNGAKIKYIYLREPNHIRSNVVAFVNELPKEFDLYKYIDYKTQFDKSFIEPLRGITDVIGWDLNIDGLTFVTE